MPRGHPGQVKETAKKSKDPKFGNRRTRSTIIGASLLPSNIKGSSLASPAMNGDGFPCRACALR
jgi:hypothetical protein